MLLTIKLSSEACSHQIQRIACDTSSASSNATSNLNTDILNVTLAGLNNSSICNELAAGPGSIPSQYSNYSTSVTPPVVSQNQTVPFSVQVGTCGTNINNWTKIWIVPVSFAVVVLLFFLAAFRHREPSQA